MRLRRLSEAARRCGGSEARANMDGSNPAHGNTRQRGSDLNRRGHLRKLRRALVLRLCIARKRGRDVGFRLRQAYGPTSWAESDFRLPIYVAAAPGGGPTLPR
jgi:hypothetical protein